MYDYDNIMDLVNLFLISYMYLYQIQKEAVKRGEKCLNTVVYDLEEYYIKTFGEECKISLLGKIFHPGITFLSLGGDNFDLSQGSVGLQ